MRIKTYWVSAITARGAEPFRSLRSTSAREAAAKYVNRVSGTTKAPILRVRVKTTKTTLLTETFDPATLTNTAR